MVGKPEVILGTLCLAVCILYEVSEPRVCGDLSQAVPLPLQLQRHHATFFACFLTFAHRFFAASAIAALPAVISRDLACSRTQRVGNTIGKLDSGKSRSLSRYCFNAISR